jgi:hypothetical protein
MPIQIVTREDIARVLTEWSNGRMTSIEVLSWADSLYPSDDVDYEDWEGEDSVTKEVLAALDMLDMNLALPEDAPIYLQFLSTPAAEFASGYREFRRKLDAIDYDRRRVQLRDIVPYASFLQNQSR